MIRVYGRCICASYLECTRIFCWCGLDSCKLLAHSTCMCACWYKFATHICTPGCRTFRCCGYNFVTVNTCMHMFVVAVCVYNWINNYCQLIMNNYLINKSERILYKYWLNSVLWRIYIYIYSCCSFFWFWLHMCLLTIKYQQSIVLFRNVIFC